jgi:hypothetical protein
MLQLDQATGRRKATLGGVVSLTVLALCSSALPANGSPASSATEITAAAVRAPSDDPAATAVQDLAVPSVPVSDERRDQGSDVVARLAPTATSGYALVGVTWTAGTATPGTVVQVATRTDGAWSTYEELEIEEEPVDATGTAGRGGTAPLWVGDADGVAVRVVSSSGQAPDDLRVSTVEPDRTTARTAMSGGAGARIVEPVKFPSMPNIVTRREWGADPDLGDTCWEPIYGRSARAVVVHHTVNSNDYSRTDAPAVVRSILAYHTQSQGWCDIGYNFLVDRFGRIYQGRRGGIRLPVRGAHAGDYNTDTVGISMIGDYDKVPPTRRLKNAMIRLIGWRLGTSYTPIYGRTRINDRRLPHIVPHGNVMSTACPGRYGYALLSELRSRVKTYLSEYDSPIKKRAAEIGRRTTGRVFVGEEWTKNGFVTTFEQGKMLAKPGLGAHWLSGRILGAYQHFGGRRVLGFPKTDAVPMRSTGVTRMIFEHGRFYKTGTKRPRLLFGRVLLRWIKTGGVGGSLGAPTTSVRSSRTKDTAKFEHGSITWNRDDGTIVVDRA